jgi:predicted kinase
LKHVIILNGAPGAGKGTFAGFFDKQSTLKISIVDSSKARASGFFGWDGEKDAAGRKLISDLYQAAMAYNTEPLHGILVQALDTQGATVIIDVRDFRVIERLRKIVMLAGLKCTTVLVERPGAQEAAEAEGLEADINTPDHKYGVRLANNGTVEEFWERVAPMFKELK